MPMRQKFSDATLMTQYIAGDYNAFNAIYQRYHKKVYAYLYKRLPSKQYANDVFQNVFIKFHKHRTIYDSKYPLMAWLYTISRCELLDYLKKQNKLLHVANATAEMHHYPVVNQRADINIDAERRLSLSERKVIKLRYLSELTFNQIAERLDLSPVAARKINSRGLRKLRLKYAGRHSV